MNVTSVTIKLNGVLHPSEDGLLAFATLVIEDALVIHGIRLIKTGQRHIVSMPNKERTVECPECKVKNFISHRYCKACGKPIAKEEILGRMFSDLVHPKNQEFRGVLETSILKAYAEERERYAKHTTNQSS
jgi:DNA-binding cell septation regulator SpoVG